jgi:LPXTG-motif cell wall-anchored protein
VDLGGAQLTLPAGWVARPHYTALPVWCLLPATAPTPADPADCPVEFSEILRGGGGLQFDVDLPGVLLPSRPPCLASGVTSERLLEYADTVFGGRWADHRRWEFGCHDGGVQQVEQYVVNNEPGYIAFSQHADAAIHAVLAQLAATSRLPAAYRALRYSDFGIVRSLSHHPDGYHLALDRVVDSAGTLINSNPATLPYVVPDIAIRSKRPIVVGDAVLLTTDGIGVFSLYLWTPATRNDLLAAAGGGSPGCGVPASGDGRLTLDRTSVRPGDTVLAVLSHFRQWPQGIVGGGSGETFASCTPWLPFPEIMAVAHDTAGLYLIHVPLGTKPGRYPVGVEFLKEPSHTDFGFHIGLTAWLTVTANPPAQVGVSPACALKHAASPVGALSTPASVRPGGTLPVSVTGVAKSYPLNEYERLYFVACLAGRATPVSYPRNPSLSFTVPVPSGLRPGSYDLVVTGIVAANQNTNANFFSWHRTVVVQGLELPATGGNLWPVIAAGAALMGAGGWLMFIARRRSGA